MSTMAHKHGDSADATMEGGMYPARSVNVVILNHEADMPHVHLLHAHLEPACREKLISLWHLGMPLAGENIESSLVAKLAKANLVLLLISADFNLAWGERLSTSLPRSKQDILHTVPIILRPCMWNGLPFYGLQPLPRDRQPLIQDGKPVEARFHSVAVEVRNLAIFLRGNAATLQNAPTPFNQLVMATLASLERDLYRVTRETDQSGGYDAAPPFRPGPVSAPHATSTSYKDSLAPVTVANQAMCLLTVEQYASLVAELAVSPAATRQIRNRYGLDDLTYLIEQERWHRRFSLDAPLFAVYSSLVQEYRARLSYNNGVAPQPVPDSQTNVYPEHVAPTATDLRTAPEVRHLVEALAETGSRDSELLATIEQAATLIENLKALIVYYESQIDGRLIKPFRTLERAVKFIDDYAGTAADLHLALADVLQDRAGLTMAIITDRVLAKGFFPDGFEKRDGFKVFKYKS